MTEESQDIQLPTLGFSESDPPGALRINDIIFDIPPEAISVSEHTFNSKYDSIRSKGSNKMLSGQGAININIRLLFCDINRDGKELPNFIAASDKLSLLIFELKKSPLCLIENEIIRSALGVPTHLNMAACLVQANISTGSAYELPQVLIADLKLIWFNYKPFAHNYTFASKWKDVSNLKSQYNQLGRQAMEQLAKPHTLATLLNSQVEQEERYPEYSSLWGDFIFNINGPQLEDHILVPEDWKSEATLTFREFRYPILRGRSLDQVEKENPNLVNVSDFSNVYGDEVDPRLRKELRESFLKISRGYYQRTGKRLLITSMYRNKAKQAALKTQKPNLANTPEKSLHVQGSAFDVQLKYHLIRKSTGQRVEATKSGLAKLSSSEKAELEQFSESNLRSGVTHSSSFELKEVNKAGADINDWLILLDLGRRENPSFTVQKTNRYYGAAESWHFQNGSLGPLTSETTPVSNLTVESLQGLINEIREKLSDSESSARLDPAIVNSLNQKLNTVEGQITPWTHNLESLFEEIQDIDGSFLESTIKAQLAALGDGWEIAVEGDKYGFYHDLPLVLNKDNAAIPVDIQIQLNNEVALLPLIGHQFATVQHMGGQESAVSMVIDLVGDKGREIHRRLIDFHRAAQEQAIHSRFFRQSNSVGIKSPVTKILNIQEAIIDDIYTTTTDNPDVLRVTINLSGNEINKRPAFSFSHTKTDLALISDLYRWIFREAGFVYSALIEQGVVVDVRFTYNNIADPLLQSIFVDISNILADHINPSNLLPTANDKWGLYSLMQVEDRLGNIGPVTNPSGDEADKEAFVLFKKLEVLFRSKILNWAVHAGKLQILPTQSQKELEMILKGFEEANNIIGRKTYNDFDLPPNPITGLEQDTNPDFFYYNTSDVLLNDQTADFYKDAIAQGGVMLRNSYSNFHRELYPDTPGNSDFYRPYIEAGVNQSRHQETSVPDASSVGQQKITFTNQTTIPRKNLDLPKGLSTHLKGLDNKIQINPNEFKGEPLNQGADVDSLIDNFNTAHVKDLYIDKLSMRRVFPAFRLTFIDEQQDLLFTHGDQNPAKLTFDDFYDIEGVKSIRLVQSRKIAADTLIVEIADPYGRLTNRRFPEKSETTRDVDLEKRLGEDISTTDPSMAQNPLKSTLLRDGISIQLKLGYDNNPNNLETKFNGKIVAVEGEGVITLVAQSFATELVSEEFGASGSDDIINYDWNADTEEIFNLLLTQPEIVHFGRYDLFNIPSLFTNLNLRADGSITETWELLPTKVPADDNVYVSPLTTYAPLLDRILDLNPLRFRSWGQTAWDIMQEMTLRHPGWICSTVPFEDRMTLFFGLPCFKYFYRQAKTIDELRKESEAEMIARGAVGINGSYEDSILSKIHKENSSNVEGLDAPFSTTQQGLPARLAFNQNDIQDRIAFKTKPFRSYHLMTSENDIIRNDIRADSRDTYNGIKMVWSDDWDERFPDGNIDPGAGFWNDVETTEVLVDDNIEPQHQRWKTVTEPNVYTSTLARRYAVGHLMRELKDLYKGSLVCIGDPKVKPYDVVYLADSYNDMFGQFEVEAVVHTLSKETGYVMDITPDLMVASNDIATVSTVDAFLPVMSTLWAELSMANLTGGLGATAIATGGFVVPAAFYGAIQAAPAIGVVAVNTVGSLSGVTIGAGAAGAALVSTPVAITLALGASAALLALGGLKIVRWAQGRQPIIITPLLRGGKPFISGIEGYEIDGLVSHINGEWKHWSKDFDLGWRVTKLNIFSALRELKDNFNE